PRHLLTVPGITSTLLEDLRGFRPIRDALSRTRGHVVLGRPPHLRDAHLPVPARARPGHRSRPRLPRGLQRGDRALQDGRVRPRRGRPRRRGPLPRPQRRARDPGRLLVPGHQAPALPVLGRRDRVGRPHGRLPPPPPHAHVRSVITMSTTSIPDPSTRYRRTGQRGINSELLSWLFMRASGLLLVILVGGKWSSPFWQVWDLLMLWLGLIHGGNGVRTIINDYARSDRLRLVLKGLLYFAVVVTIILGTLVIFTFDPCPVGAEPSLLPSFCEG